MSPSGAVRAGPPAAQANRTANFNAHEYIFEQFLRGNAGHSRSPRPLRFCLLNYHTLPSRFITFFGGHNL